MEANFGNDDNDDLDQKERGLSRSSESVGRHAPGAVRHAEKRRTGTCPFADRIGTVSLECFRQHIPASFRETQKQTCVAAIVAHFAMDGRLEVQGLGVGTKFMSEEILKAAEAVVSEKDHAESLLAGLDGHSYDRGYGIIVRDCHAEVLARRAFRRQLYEDMRTQRDGCILEEGSGDRFHLKSGVTLHMYTSSAPCGNSTIKKFATMQKEVFDSNMHPNEWPSTSHQVIPPHSIKLGQFALLLKKDRTLTSLKNREPFDPGRSWPANISDDWCPPGTTIVWSNQGSIHTCSDKICRWNYLGMQGSLLSALMEAPVYMKSLTVGRKFTSCICRRAACCRAVEKGTAPSTGLALNHPAIMGTGVYMDDSGTLSMCNESEFGQDVRFNSFLCFAWWPQLGDDLERIDGSSGLAVADDNSSQVSRLSTASFFQLHYAITGIEAHVGMLTLDSLRSIKNALSPVYERAKDALLTKHKLFRSWRRRGH